MVVYGLKFHFQNLNVVVELLEMTQCPYEINLWFFASWIVVQICLRDLKEFGEGGSHLPVVQGLKGSHNALLMLLVDGEEACYELCSGGVDVTCGSIPGSGHDTISASSASTWGVSASISAWGVSALVSVVTPYFY